MILFVMHPMTMMMMVLLLFYYQVSQISSYMIILTLYTNDWFNLMYKVATLVSMIVMFPFEFCLVVFGARLLLLVLTARTYSWLYVSRHAKTALVVAIPFARNLLFLCRKEGESRWVRFDQILL